MIPLQSNVFGKKHWLSCADSKCAEKSSCTFAGWVACQLPRRLIAVGADACAEGEGASEALIIA